MFLLASIKKTRQQILFIAMVSGMQFSIATKHLADLSWFAALLGAYIITRGVVVVLIISLWR
eukprot:9082906-Ditylum_brightwellii.AAC.1